MTVKVTHAQKALLSALSGFPGGADNLTLTHALRGPLREPTVSALVRGGYIETVGQHAQRRIYLTNKGKCMAGVPT